MMFCQLINKTVVAYHFSIVVY